MLVFEFVSISVRLRSMGNDNFIECFEQSAVEPLALKPAVTCGLNDVGRQNGNLMLFLPRHSYTHKKVQSSLTPIIGCKLITLHSIKHRSLFNRRVVPVKDDEVEGGIEAGEAGVAQLKARCLASSLRLSIVCI